jgi:type VI secretion system protein ImpA
MTMDLDALLAPIAPDAPGGADLSLSPQVDAIHEMRREDDPTLDQGEWVAALKVADWPGVVQACESLLSTQTKDMRIAGWLTDARARLHGFVGLHDGLSLYAGLLSRHWSSLYPLIEDGDADERIGNLAWLAGRVRELAHLIELIPDGRHGVSLAEVEAARARRLAPDQTPSERSSARAEGSPPTLEAIQRLVTQRGTEALTLQLAQMDATQAVLRQVEQTADEYLQGQAPSFGAAREAIDQARSALARLGREAGLLGGTGAAEEDASPEPAAGTPGPRSDAAPVSGVPQTRAQALQQLRLVAEFFRRTEPHSPVAYLADKAAQWGTMPLHDWLRSVVKDGGSLSHIEELLGIQRPDGV